MARIKLSDRAEQVLYAIQRLGEIENPTYLALAFTLGIHFVTLRKCLWNDAGRAGSER